MTNPVYFFQPCPVCGRSLRIRVGLLGRQVYCGHCQGHFTAAAPSLTAPRSGPVLRPLEPAGPAEERVSDDRVEDLLDRATRRLAEVGCPDERRAAS